MNNLVCRQEWNGCRVKKIASGKVFQSITLLDIAAKSQSSALFKTWPGGQADFSFHPSIELMDRMF